MVSTRLQSLAKYDIIFIVPFCGLERTPTFYVPSYPPLLKTARYLFALDILKKRRSNGSNGKGAVFGYPYETFHAAFKRACKKAGIKGVTPHTLRHTFATRLIEQGEDIITTKALLHHSSLEMTERYTHPDDRRNREAVERLAQNEKKVVTYR